MKLHAWLVLVSIAVLGCDKSTSPPSETPAADAKQGGLPDRDPKLAHHLVRDEGALLLDVRTQEEFDAGAIEGAVLIPHDQLPDRIQEVLDAQGGDKSKPIVVYCGSGRRAGIAKQTLLDAGFQNVMNLGAIGDWCEDC